MDKHQPTILTIEDDQLVRKAIASYLQSMGYAVLEAADGAEGLEIFRRAHPDLILTDLRLPKLDGMMVLSTIREESPDTPVIIVSGMGTLNDAIKALKLGARDYVTKPITDMGLIRYGVERAIEHANLVRENRRYQTFLEDEVQKKTAELHQAQKLEAIGTLAGGIAHDFNNILAAIMGFTELALFKTEKDSELADNLQQVLKASNRAKDLVLQILTFSRKGDTDRHPIQASLVIKEALKLLEATLPATVQLRQQITAKKTMILADPTEIHQVITNLCTNAFHALSDEQGTITVALNELHITEDEMEKYPQLTSGNYLQLTVSDTGCGMEPATLNAIFDPFFTTKEKGQGTGLGLSVVHGIVTDCNGSISVKSELNKGTSFTLLLPTIEATKDKEVEATVPLPSGNERILFIDDEEDLRKLAGKMLAYLGYSVVCCGSGEEALEKVGKSRSDFDLVITDQSMPRMPGTELARKLLAICPGLPILLCTGFSSMVDEEKALAIGIRGFLMKPLSISTMAKEVRRILEN
jgi:CheY-like chemotaxis protein